MKRDNLLLLGLMLFLTPRGVLAQVAPAGQGTSNDRDSAATVRRGRARPVRLTVAPHAHSPIAMAALPNATCSLHAEGDESQAVKLFADDEGMVHFAVNPDGESEAAAPLVLDCEAGGVAQSFPLELRSNSTPTVDMPASTEEVRKPRRNAFVQPALTGDEASTLSNEELAARGYPTRPDPKASAKAHATWLQGVTQPMTFVPPTHVINPDRSHGAACCAQPYHGQVFVDQCCGGPTSANWSGFQLQGSFGQSPRYSMVQGTWHVPNVIAPNSYTPTYSAFWVGLDGANTFTSRYPGGCCYEDLVQAGTEQEVKNIWVGYALAITNYYAWFEFLPQDPYEKVLSNIPVSPGDVISSYVWIGPASTYFPANLSGPTAWFEVYNVTRGVYTIVNESRTYYAPYWGTYLTTDVPGYEAEWIMERPTINGVLPDLAHYGQGSEPQAGMWNAYALLNNTSTWVPANGSNTTAISMYTGTSPNGQPLGNLLSYPAGVTCNIISLTTHCTPRYDEVLFTWNGWH